MLPFEAAAQGSVAVFFMPLASTNKCCQLLIAVKGGGYMNDSVSNHQELAEWASSLDPEEGVMSAQERDEVVRLLRQHGADVGQYLDTNLVGVYSYLLGRCPGHVSI